MCLQGIFKHDNLNFLPVLEGYYLNYIFNSILYKSHLRNVQNTCVKEVCVLLFVNLFVTVHKEMSNLNIIFK